ncbi:uncharacterized protein PGTG_12421 [Puccinia graminis f. sp. tritici CRL 75-36-700-3]|uniref:GCM domain-containing protein n=1 Tax=Puccinia graminis f. sp. tritici (strain CRL 75-36-700-3 / race SCCL) TaxID=418459 RepID=E3KQ90_PUCGT|nr:uncharacterized protein PGTG_12421 [Puccinia graminis f. sp. tritici CRL 75-36-700-3]EFP86465.1 hypothetical protein PGTG_12421 [Puccinia graminis f. sp. tritici CRL 75-36-700-3]
MSFLHSSNEDNTSVDYSSESSYSEDIKTPVISNSTRLSRGKPTTTAETTLTIPSETNNKTFFLPTMNEKTFIDHGCTLDAEGYPLLPNGNTIFVKPSGIKVTNFGNVGFTKRTGSEYRSKGTWKLTRIYCLGSLACDLPQCRWAGAPPTGRVVMSEYLERYPHCRGSAGKCPGNIRHHTCKNTLIRVDEHVPTGWAVLRHKGQHEHPWPEVKKPDKLAKEALKNEILKNPKAGALSLKLGKPIAPRDPYDSVMSIHPALRNADRLRYYRKLMLREMNITPEKLGAGVGDKFINDMFMWNNVIPRRGLQITSASFLDGSEHFTFQTEWMAKRLLARDLDNRVYSGGLVSDVTYRFFENGYLLSTSMYVEEITRWVPVQLTWIRGLSAGYYRIHFATLFRQFLKPEITEVERDILVRNIVDFSLAQREGFIEAYGEVFGIFDRAQVLGKLQGCHQHYRAQVTRIRVNRNVIMAGDEVNFQQMCMDLIKEPQAGDPTHEEKIDALRRQFPKAKRWIDWWTMADVESMLFPSRRPQDEDAPEGVNALPKTSNAQESLHRLYYMISPGKTSLLVGMVQLFSFVKVLEEDFDAVMRGISIEYGSQRKGDTDVAQSIGWEKSRKRAPKAVPLGPGKKIRHEYANDGRAPDTTKALLPEIIKKKLGRPSGAPNINRNPFNSYPSYHASKKEHLKNRCWMAASVESLYAVFSPIWLQGSSGCGTSLFTTLVKHFTARATYELTEAGSIRSILSKAQCTLFHLVSAQHPRSFVAGKFASADFFLDVILDRKANPNRALKGLFEVEEVRQLTCKHHTKAAHELRRPSHVINIRRKAFESNELEFSDVASFLRQWTGSGLDGWSGLCCKLCNSSHPSSEMPTYGRASSDVEVAISTLVSTSSPKTPMLQERSCLAFIEDQPPAHLYFHLDVTPILDEDEQQSFMAVTDWPFTLYIRHVRYNLFARGFWDGSHYWCKVVRHVRGRTGVWLHNDRTNDGYAQLVSPIPSDLGGTAAHTSWLIYSRAWNDSELEFVNDKITQIKKDNPRATGQVPFAKLEELLEVSKDLDLGTVKPDTDNLVMDVFSNDNEVPNGNETTDDEDIKANEIKPAPSAAMRAPKLPKLKLILAKSGVIGVPAPVEAVKQIKSEIKKPKGSKKAVPQGGNRRSKRVEAKGGDL